VKTFVVQIWAQAGEANATGGELRRFVEHVGSGRREAFRSARDLIAFFESQQDPQPQEVER